MVRRHQKPPTASCKLLYARWKNGETLKVIAKSCGVSPQTLRLWFAKDNLIEDAAWTLEAVERALRQWYAVHQDVITYDDFRTGLLPRWKYVLPHFGSIANVNAWLGVKPKRRVIHKCLECKARVPDPYRFCSGCRHRLQQQDTPSTWGLHEQGFHRCENPWWADHVPEWPDPKLKNKAHNGMIQIRRY